MQPGGHQRGVVPPVGLQEVQRLVHVPGEAAEPYGVRAVLVGDRAGRCVIWRVDIRDRGRCGKGPDQIRKDRVDGRGHAAGEERRHIDGQQDVHGGPVATADRTVRTEVFDRLGCQQAALVAVEGHEDRLQVLVERKSVAHAEQRVHVPAERQRPRVLGNLVVHAGIAVDRHHLHSGCETVARDLGANPAAQLGDEVHEILRTLEARGPGVGRGGRAMRASGRGHRCSPRPATDQGAGSP